MYSRRIMLVLTILFVTGAGTVAGTVWPLSITNAVTWTQAGSPHTWPSGTLTVGSGGAVTIEPGAVVNFALGQQWTVSAGGRVLALGSVEAPIRLGGLSETTKGGSLDVNTSLTCQFRFCHFSNLTQIRISSQAPQGNHLFEHCVFRKFADHPIHLANAPATILHSIFRDNPADKYGVAMTFGSFSDETCPTIWHNVFDRFGLLVTATDYAGLQMNNYDFFRFNRVAGGVGVWLSGGRAPWFGQFRLLDCDLGDAAPSLRLSSTAGWDGAVEAMSIERCTLSTLTRSSIGFSGGVNLANNYWGTTNMATIAAALFDGDVSTNDAMPIATTNLFPQADVDGSDGGNRTRQADADIVKRAVVGLITLTPEEAAIADVDRNGVVETRDALLIESYINNLLWKLPVP